MNEVFNIKMPERRKRAFFRVKNGLFYICKLLYINEIGKKCEMTKINVRLISPFFRAVLGVCIRKEHFRTKYAI